LRCILGEISNSQLIFNEKENLSFYLFIFALQSKLIPFLGFYFSGCKIL
jgi:hypothetical protein